MSGVKPKVTLFMTSKYSNLGGRLLLAEQKYSHQKKLKKINSTPTLNKYAQEYAMTSSEVYPTDQYGYSSARIKKANFYQQQAQTQHYKNLIHLAAKVNRPKTLTDRKKDPNDFYAYPVYFFREVKNRSSSKRSASSKFGQAYDQRRLKSKHLKKGQNYIGDFDEYGIKKRQKVPKKTGKKRKIYTYHQNLQRQNPNNQYLPQVNQFQEKHGYSNLSNLKNALNEKNIRSYLPYLHSFSNRDIEQFSQAVTKIVMKFNIQSQEQLAYLKKIILSDIPKTYPSQFNKIVHEIFEELSQL